jgi:localization factor PodJL
MHGSTRSPTRRQAVDEAPKGLSLAHVEQQISDIAQQLGRAEAHRQDRRNRKRPAQADRAGGCSPALKRWHKAAEEAARLVAAEAKLSSSGTAERVDAMHRDLMAMNDRTRASDDRLAGTIESGA